jgi:hypothetical protein
MPSRWIFYDFDIVVIFSWSGRMGGSVAAAKLPSPAVFAGLFTRR